MDINQLREGLILLLVLVGSISIHEWAHAYTADKFGDDTPRSQGRVTLNPVSHFDPIGTGIIPFMNIMGFFGGLAMIGWGKPVMVNRDNFSHRVRGDIVVAMAGPFSNLVIALAATIVGGLLYRYAPSSAQLFGTILYMNVGLAMFNMVPIPPLDGSHVMRHAIGMSENAYIAMSRVGGLLLLVLINIPVFRGVLSSVIAAVATPYIALFRALAAWG